MSVHLYTCKNCGHFSHAGFLMVDSTSCYDYQCPVCDSKEIDTEFTDDEYYTEVELTTCEDEHASTAD